MTQEVSTPGFTLGQFDRSSRRLPASDIDSINRLSFLSSYQLYRLGCMLEDRVLLAQGMRLGIFPADLATEWLVEVDGRLQDVMRIKSIEENWQRLPMYLPAEDLLNTQSPSESSDTDQFRSMLLFRSYISTLGLDRFYEELIFASDERWTRQIESARSRRDGILSDEPSSLPDCYGIYDAVQLCADLLAWQTGLPLGNVDPWGSPRRLPAPMVPDSTFTTSRSLMSARLSY